MSKGRAYDKSIKPNLDKIKHWIQEGYSHKQIWQMLGISEPTFYKYQNKNDKDFKQDFFDALQAGKKGLQIKLEEALYKEAMGYEYTETSEEVEIDDSEGKKKTKQKKRKTTKVARPNVNALIFALCNKFPEKWRRIDKDVVEAIENNNINLNITDRHIKDAFKALYPAMEEKDNGKDENKKKE